LQFELFLAFRIRY